MVKEKVVHVPNMILVKSSIAIITVLLLGKYFFSFEDDGESTNTLKKLENDGYIGEFHSVTTEDGYILGLQRIVHGPNNENQEIKSSNIRIGHPVLLMHGLESSSLDWIDFQEKGNSLPYLLHGEGFDVWLGNARGTPHSYNHTRLNPDKDAAFWDISLHEIGYYDVPAMVNYISNATRFEKISFIGMSQGEATLMIALSTRPELNEKIQLGCLLSAASHLKYTSNDFLKAVGKYWRIIQKVTRYLGIWRTNFRNSLRRICRYSIFSTVCQSLMYKSLGTIKPDQEQYTLDLTMKSYPNHSGFRQFLHFLQMFDSGIFRQFDYEIEGNLARYGTEEPPEYDLAKISAPMAYFWGAKDNWSSPKDVSVILSKLPNVALNYEVPDEHFNHFDSLGAKHAKDVLYNKMIELIHEFSVPNKKNSRITKVDMK